MYMCIKCVFGYILFTYLYLFVLYRLGEVCTNYDRLRNLSTWSGIAGTPCVLAEENPRTEDFFSGGYVYCR